MEEFKIGFTYALALLTTLLLIANLIVLTATPDDQGGRSEREARATHNHLHLHYHASSLHTGRWVDTETGEIVGHVTAHLPERRRLPPR